MNPVTVFNICLAYANRLRFKSLFFLVTGLLILDLLIPDIIPMIDEVILALMTVMLANIKKNNAGNEKSGETGVDVMEGEVIESEQDHDV